MIFWICLAIVIGGFVWGYFDPYSSGPVTLIVVFGLVSIILLTIIGCNKWAPDAKLASKLAERDAIIYQLDTEMYDNDNDLGKKELMNEVRDWNSGIAYRKLVQENFWIGIFYPNIYDQIDLIELVN